MPATAPEQGRGKVISRSLIMSYEPVHYFILGNFEVSFYVTSEGSVEAFVVDSRDKTTPAFIAGKRLREIKGMWLWQFDVNYMDGVESSRRHSYARHHLIAEKGMNDSGLPFRFEVLAYRVAERL